MSPKEIQDLLKLVTKLELSEFKFKNDDVKLTVRTKHYSAPGGSGMPASGSVISVPAVAPAYSTPASAAPAAPAEEGVPLAQ